MFPENIFLVQVYTYTHYT